MRLMTPGVKAIIIDVETGGFSRSTDALLEVAALIVDHEFVILDHFQHYILPEPGKLISPDAAAVNGYKPELWGIFGDHAPTPAEIESVVSPLASLSEVQEEIRVWLNGRGGMCGIAFHKGFDKAWCKDFLPALHDACLPEWRDPCVAYSRWLKLKKGVQKVEKGMTKLSAACDSLHYQAVTGETWERHTALDDCYAARFVAEQMDRAGLMHDA